MNTNLDNLSGPGRPLKAEPHDALEEAGLVQSGLARLRDARRTELSLESRFDLAYNAAHALSLVALRRQGFRPSHRYIVFQVLPLTLGVGPDVWRVLDLGHRQRNTTEYEGTIHGVTESLVNGLIEATTAVAEALRVV